MTEDFKSARHWARELMLEACKGARVIVDATMGNGHDTLWLAKNAPENCRVIAFDIQTSAVESTRRRLDAENARAELICAGHERLGEFISEPVDLCAFNLGWLPGGDHGVTTRAETTVIAADAAAKLLASGGLMTICVYPGHDEGKRERGAVIEWASRLDSVKFDVIMKQYLNQANDPPLLIAVRRRT